MQNRIFESSSTITPTIIDASYGKTTFIRYKSVIEEMMKISYKIELRCTDTEKLHKFAFYFAQKILHGIKPQKYGENTPHQYCIRSQISKSGYTFDAAGQSKGQTFVIADEYGAVADEILGLIRNEAVSRNINVICCCNPFLQGSLERVIIDGGTVTVCRESSLCVPESSNRKIHASRFINKDKFAQNRETLKFNSKIIKELLPHCHQNLG